MAREDNYKKSIKILQDLKRDYPTYTLAQHLATATEDYEDVWCMSDKEFVFALEKYRADLDMNTPDDELRQIIEDGMNLDKYILGSDPYHLIDDDDEIEERQ